MVELGLRAEALLGSETFKFVVAHLVAQYTDNILTTEFGDREAREKNFHLHHALQDLVSQLEAYAAQAHAMVEQDQQKDDE